MAALTLIAPSAALAHGSRHRGHHRKAARGAHVSFRHLGPVATSTTGPGSTPSAGTGSTPPSALPSTPTTPPSENAGKVASYTGGVLTLTLADGSSVSGKVTERTQIECTSATPTPPPGGQSDEGAPGDESGMGDDQSGGERNQVGGWQDAQQPPGAGQWQGGEGDNGAGDDQSEEGTIASEPPCDSSALVEGAIVHAAELRITPSGTEFESIELVR